MTVSTGRGPARLVPSTSSLTMAPCSIPKMAVILGWFSEASTLRFALEASHAGRVLCESLGQDFDGDVAVQLGVGGAVDGAHAAFAELGPDPVVGDRLFGAHR